MLTLLVSTDGSWIPAAGFEAESATNGREFLAVWRGQASEVALNCTAGCDPCDALVDIAAGWRRSEEVGFFVGYPPVGSVAERSIDNGIPSNATIMFGGSFSEGVGDPFDVVANVLGWDPDAGPFGDLDRGERDHLKLMFQVRHSFEHNGGVVDDDFCRTVPGMNHLVGRRYPLNRSDADALLRLLPGLGRKVVSRVQALADGND